MAQVKGYVNAKYVGPGEALAILADGTEHHLIPGETVVAISKGEAEASSNWDVQGGRVGEETPGTPEKSDS